MTSIYDPRAYLTAILVLAGLLSILKGKDPIVLGCRWAYAFRRAVWILGSMAWDSAGEFRHRWKSQRPQDAEELRQTAARYPAGETE